MSRDAETQRAMHAAITRRLQEGFQLSERHASDYATEALEALGEEFGGSRLYIAKPSGKPEVSGAVLREHLLGGMKPKDVQKLYGLSSSKFYRLLAKGNDDA